MRRIFYTVVATAIIAVVVVPVAQAASSVNSQLTQQINAGVLSTDVRDASNALVASPSFAMSDISVSTSQQTATGTLGTSSQRLSVDNPGGANNGWTLALNATTPGTGKWVSGGNSYAYNGLPAAGQLTVDPSVGTVTPVTGSATGVTKGTSAAFTGTTPITLISASSSTATIWNGYLTGVNLSQTIPAAQAGGSYSISMTQTVTAS